MCWRSGQTDCTRKERCVIIKKLKGNQARYSEALPKQIREKKEARLASHSFGGIGSVIRNVRYGVCGWQAAGSRELDVSVNSQFRR